MICFKWNHTAVNYGLAFFKPP